MTSESHISNEEFYSDGVKYWSEIPATVEGMLGGFGFISQTDIKGSKALLKHLFNSKNPPGRNHALDCGSGIGRIAKFLLTDLFDKVDLVDQNPMFIEKAKNYIGVKSSKIDSYYSVGLQYFIPEKEKYDVIWIQWVIGHLTDEDLIKFLNSCRNGLKLNGVVILKENITSSNELEMDRKDSSVTRPMHVFMDLFSKTNLYCDRKVKQQHFPKGLYSVYMFVLKPKEERILANEDSSSVEPVNHEIIDSNIK